MTAPRAVVIGAGVAGLATAALLTRNGYQVEVLEKQSRVGGRAGIEQLDGFTFDSGPSWYLMPRVYEQFFNQCGTSVAEQLDLKMLDPGYVVFSEPDGMREGGQRTVVPYGAARVRELFEALEPGSGPAFDRYLDSAKTASRLAEQFFLYNPFTRWGFLRAPEVMRRTPQLVRLLGQSLESFIAKRFRHPVLRQILGYPAVFLGTNPADAPAMYHLMSALDLDEGVQYPMGGFWSVVESLERLALDGGAQIQLNAEVLEIVAAPVAGAAKPQVTGVVWRDQNGIERTTAADIVVSAGDLHHTETALLPAAQRTYDDKWWRRRVSGPGAVLVMLGVDGPLPELEHHSLFFTRDWKANFEAIFGPSPFVPDPISLYVCKPGATDPGVAPPGAENLFVLVPVPADVTIGSGGVDGKGDPNVEAIADAAIRQVADWAGIPDLAGRIRVRKTIGPKDFAQDYHSWQGGMLGPAHTLRQSAMFRAQNASRRVQGLYYAGGTTAPGVGVPMCLISAELVLKRIRRDHSAGPLPLASEVVSR